jgi:hypothetical protein
MGTKDRKKEHEKNLKVIYPEWLSDKPDAVQRACDKCPPGGGVVLTKTYVTNPIVLGPQHAGIAIVGLGSPLPRFVDTGGGAALYLKDGANANVISIVGTSGERVSITLKIAPSTDCRLVSRVATRTN